MHLLVFMKWNSLQLKVFFSLQSRNLATIRFRLLISREFSALFFSIYKNEQDAYKDENLHDFGQIFFFVI